MVWPGPISGHADRAGDVDPRRAAHHQPSNSIRSKIASSISSSEIPIDVVDGEPSRLAVIRPWPMPSLIEDPPP